MQIKNEFYVATQKETLKDIAVKTGADYDELLKFNPNYKNGVPVGAKVVLKIDFPEEQSETKKEEASKKEDNVDKNNSETTSNKTASEKNTQQSDSSFDKEKYQQDLINLNLQYSQKEKKLAESFKKSRNKSEKDFVEQKITDSSIAKHERAKQGEEFLLKKEKLGSEYNEKIQKLMQSFDKTNKKI